MFTEPLRQLAERLDFHPVKIYEFVKNTIRYEPYSGSLKGAAQTLLEGAGNDIDIASLLVALLRISRFPTRYIIGEVTLEKEKALSWLKVHDLRVAGQLLASNEIPVTLLLEDGQPAALQLEHVWVETYIPFGNYRGSGSDPSIRRWSPLDASFKTHTFSPRRNVLVEAGVDVASILAILDQAVEQDASGAVISLNTAQLEDVMQAALTQVESHAKLTSPDAFINEFRGVWVINKQTQGILPATIPMRINRVLKRTARLDDDVHHKLRIQLSFWPYGLAQPEEFGGLNLLEIDFTAPTALIAGKRLTLSYRPATPDDQVVIDEFGGRLTVPPYLVRLRPQLLLDGQRVGEKQVDDITMGLPENLWYQLIPPRQMQGELIENVVTAGSFYAFGFDLGTVPARQVKTLFFELANRLKTLPTRTETEVVSDTLLGAALQLTAMAYWAQADFLNKVAVNPAELHLQRLPFTDQQQDCGKPEEKIRVALRHSDTDK
ncbi:MAG: transglutaminase domain-containing protein [Candidatus Tectomicrobia bacterium]|nr:transglutaminase domain-containing protein [Candidatus Tectomicrobia bacterium]